MLVCLGGKKEIVSFYLGLCKANPYSHQGLGKGIEIEGVGK